MARDNIAIWVAIAASAMATYNVVRITQLDAEILSLKQKITILVSITNLHSPDVKIDKAKMVTRILINTIYSKYYSKSSIPFRKGQNHNIIVSAQHHRLSPGVLPHDVLNKIIKKYTTEVSENHHYIPLAHHPSDFSLIKTSNIINYKYDLFTLNLHIQLVALSNLLQLYKFIHLLLKFYFQANLSFTPNISHNNLITISHSKSFQALYSVDLYSCLHLWET